MGYLLSDSQAGYVMGDQAYDYSPEADSTPDAFVFEALSAVDLYTTVVRTALLQGIDSGESVSVTNGHLSVDGGNTWVSGPVNFVPGQTYVRAAVTTGGLFSHTHSVTVTVNGVSAVFVVITRSVPASGAIVSINNGNPISPGATVQIQSTGIDWSDVVAIFLRRGAVHYPIPVTGTNTVTIPAHVPGGNYSLALRILSE